MARLYGLDLRPYESGRWRELLETLPPERQQKALTCRFSLDQARSAGAGWLLQYALEQAGIPAARQNFDKTALGKPFLADHQEIHFSLSHTGSWVTCAVSHDPVGVDVEMPRCTYHIGQRFFQPQELEGLDQLEHFQCRDQLNRLWTGKESFVKALGGGLTIPLNSFTVKLHEDHAELIQDLSPLPYRLHEYRADVCRVCLCTTEDRPELQWITP